LVSTPRYRAPEVSGVSRGSYCFLINNIKQLLSRNQIYKISLKTHSPKLLKKAIGVFTLYLISAGILWSFVLVLFRFASGFVRVSFRKTPFYKGKPEEIPNKTIGKMKPFKRDFGTKPEKCLV